MHPALPYVVIAGLIVTWTAETLTTPGPVPPPQTITWAYTRPGDKPDVMLSDGIRAATFRVDAALYGLNRRLDVDALLETHARCGCVRLMTDTVQAGGASQKSALLRLQASGIPVKSDRHAGLMHLKAVSVDLAVLYEGSFNATDSASLVNDEVLFRLAAPEAAQAFSTEFDAMWSDARRYRDWSPAE